MNLQFISDSTGKTTGVFIPIKKWNKLKNKFKGNEQKRIDIPDWHKDVISKRLENYASNPDQAVDFEASIEEIEKDM